MSSTSTASRRLVSGRVDPGVSDFGIPAPQAVPGARSGCAAAAAVPRARRRAGPWVRWLFLVHRYLGIAVGLVMALWCLSGFVMMYVQYPEMTGRDRLAALAPLGLEACCELPADALADLPSIERFRVEMLAGTPVLRVEAAFGAGGGMYDLRRGEAIETLDAGRLRQSAEAFQRQAGLPGPVRGEGELFNDQWTVYAAYHPHRPLHKFSADDPAGTEWYVSGTTGEVVQVTTAHQRFWNWMGAVVHWLYPTKLREHTAVWYQLVIWLTILGIFLTVIGLYIGLRQFRSRSSGRYSPYRGAALWHHYSGLIFGVLVLSWTASGLFSMNPWGLLEGEGAGPERGRLQGVGLKDDAVRDFVSRLDTSAHSTLPAGTVRLEGHAFDGALIVLAQDGLGGTQRLDARLQPAPLTPADWSVVPHRLLPGVPVASAGWLTSGDAYYYEHHEELDFPVYRVVFSNPDRTRYYLDADSASVLRKVDSERRWYRWVFHALHRGDFSALARSRPVWDIFMWLLLSGVAVSCVTGAWMGFRRLRRG